MKKTFLILLFVVVLTLAAALWLLNHYVLKTNRGFVVLDKRFMTFTDTYVDTRTWSSEDFDSHPEIKKAMISQGYRDVLTELKIREIKASMKKIYDKAEDGADAVQRKVDEWLKCDKSEPNDPNVGEPNSTL